MSLSSAHTLRGGDRYTGQAAETEADSQESMTSDIFQPIAVENLGAFLSDLGRRLSCHS